MQAQVDLSSLKGKQLQTIKTTQKIRYNVVLYNVVLYKVEPDNLPKNDMNLSIKSYKLKKVFLKTSHVYQKSREQNLPKTCP